jgi:formylglycine-generating enzyme required for sulfatase activity
MASEPTAPEDTASLQRRIAELQSQLAALQAQPTATGVSADADGGRMNTGRINTGTRTTIETQGGAAIDGGVRTQGGHFIGRDFVQTITNITHSGDDGDEVKSVIALYLHALVVDLSGLKLGEIDASVDQTQHSPLQLADIYVPADTTMSIAEDQTLRERLADLTREDPKLRRDFTETTPTRSVAALEALAEHRELTLLGTPGSGKSTFGASVLLTLAQSWQGHAGELGKMGATWTHGALLPIRVVLRRFAEQLPAGDAPGRAGDLWAFIARDLDASGQGLSPDAMKYIQRVARTHGALVLFDGLDECGNAARRGRVRAAVDEFMRSAGPACRFLLTGRPYAWPSGPDASHGVYMLADLDDAQIEQFIRAWYAALVKRGWRSPGDAERKIEDLLGARERDDLRPLAQNPLLLTLMVALHTNRGGLPEDRADLYDDSVALLLERWNRQIGADKALLDELAEPGLKLSDLRSALEKLAFEVHEQSLGSDGAADIGEPQLLRAFRPLLGNSRDKAAVVVDYIERRAGLLLGQGERDGERQFTFPHRTFQEFLAACHLESRDNFAARCVELANAGASHWSVVLTLAARVAKAERGATAADALIGGRAFGQFAGRLSAANWTRAMLAGAQLHEIGLAAVNNDELRRAIAERVAGWLAAALPVHPADGGLPAARRAEAGDLLAALGDPRFDPARLSLPADGRLGFVRVAADPAFRIGTRKAHAKRVAKVIGTKVSEDEINDRPTPTSEFYIARYPVTVAQFRAFVEATQFRPGDADALRGAGNRPVTSVDWREASAYAAWLNDMLARSPLFANDALARLVREEAWRIDLPSELEWEKAARADLPDAVFSWGDAFDAERANCAEAGLGRTSGVGCFPANGYGVSDMLGNAWEWTRTAHGPYPYPARGEDREPREPTDSQPPVVRGGSWRSRRGSARCACRGRGGPGGRGNLGFRVVLRSAPVS